LVAISRSYGTFMSIKPFNFCNFLNVPLGFPHRGDIDHLLTFHEPQAWRENIDCVLHIVSYRTVLGSHQTFVRSLWLYVYDLFSLLLRPVIRVSL
jgi:hypothetical protein